MISFNQRRVQWAGAVENIDCTLQRGKTTPISVVVWFGLVSLFNGISTFVGYLMPKSECNSMTEVRTCSLQFRSPSL